MLPRDRRQVRITISYEYCANSMPFLTESETTMLMQALSAQVRIIEPEEL